MINAYLDQLARDYPNTVSVETIGKSFEGKDMKVIKISTNATAKKPVIFIDAGIHSNEWIGPPVALYTIHQLVEYRKGQRLLEKVDWHILPVLNPDGYVYTHTGERFWKKSRSAGGNCMGTNLNRNFDFHWEFSHECNEAYPGTKAFSEPETAALKNHILKHKNEIKLYLTFHSYGNLILYPWGYTDKPPKNSDELKSLGKAVAKSIKKATGSTYRIGSSSMGMYQSLGSSDDWVKGVGGVELSYRIQLPAGGSFNYDPPPQRIFPIVWEMWEGILTYHKYISKKYGKVH